jgi:hypothetical protein
VPQHGVVDDNNHIGSGEGLIIPVITKVQVAHSSCGILFGSDIHIV